MSSSGSDQVSEVHVPHGNRPALLNRAIFPGFKETFTLQGKHIFFLNQIFFQADLTAVIELDCDAQTLPIYMAYPGNDDGESELVGIQEGKEKNSSSSCFPVCDDLCYRGMKKNNFIPEFWKKTEKNFLNKNKTFKVMF